MSKRDPVSRIPETNALVAWQRHAELKKNVEAMLANPAETYFPIACRSMVDIGVHPMVMAKRLLIGDRAGDAVYRESTAQLSALADQESACEVVVVAGWQHLPRDLAAFWAAIGAAWLATQYGIGIHRLGDLVVAPYPAHPVPPDFAGCGALDIMRHLGAPITALVELLHQCQLPQHAPLVFRPYKAPT